MESEPKINVFDPGQINFELGRIDSALDELSLSVSKAEFLSKANKLNQRLLQIGDEALMHLTDSLENPSPSDLNDSKLVKIFEEITGKKVALDAKLKKKVIDYIKNNRIE